MPLDYGDMIRLQDVDVDVDVDEGMTLHADDNTDIPEGMENKVTLPDTMLDYVAYAEAWDTLGEKVRTMEGYGVKTLQDGIGMVSYHLKLADTHLTKVKTSLETVNSERRQRMPRSSTQVKLFTTFFNKLNPIQFEAQLKLFNIPPGMDRQALTAELVHAAMNGGE